MGISGDDEMFTRLSMGAGTVASGLVNFSDFKKTNTTLGQLTINP
jgi:hypothetical protein